MRLLLTATIILLTTAAAADDALECLTTSGRANTHCLETYLFMVERCRRAADPVCEEALRAEDGKLAQTVLRSEEGIRAVCTDPASEQLGYTSTNDVVIRAQEWCIDFGDDFANLAFADDLTALDESALACQQVVASQLRRIRREVVRLYGPRCFLRATSGGICGKARRDSRVAFLKTVTQQSIEQSCGSAYEALGLGSLTDLLDTVVTRARHFAIRVYPPNDHGPTGEFGPYPIGVTTLALSDPARMNAQGTGPRPVLTEVYYPSTSAAIAGVPRDVVRVLNVPIVATPAYRDVAIAPGPFPLVLFSHGNLGIRFQSFFFAAHLASHGYVVVTPDHHGNTFVDALNGISDPQVAVNRPLDLSFLIDQFLAFNGEAGNQFEGAIIPDAIGASGHSFGGFTVFALAGQGGDARIRAIVPQAPAAPFSDTFLQGIAIPVLIIGGSIDTTTPFEQDQQRPFDLLPSGAPVVALAEIANAGHFTFSDFCEVQRSLLSFLGGFDEACEPRHLPWRHAHEIIDYLALNFFDAVLRDDAEALARLSPAVLGQFDDLRWQSK
jgi:predicted dienelactone hydrolase